MSEAGNQDLLGAIIGIDFIHDTNIKGIIHIFSENPPSTITLDMVSSVICHIALPLYPEQWGIGKELFQRSRCPLVSLGVVEL